MAAPVGNELFGMSIKRHFRHDGATRKVKHYPAATAGTASKLALKALKTMAGAGLARFALSTSKAWIIRELERDKRDQGLGRTRLLSIADPQRRKGAAAEYTIGARSCPSPCIDAVGGSGHAP
jgi:hypothetical protein